MHKIIFFFQLPVSTLPFRTYYQHIKDKFNDNFYFKSIEF